MINLDECYLLGVITKPHGVRGNLIIRLDRFTFDDFKEMETVFIEIDGLPVPFFVLEYTDRPPDSIIILLEDISDETSARLICGCNVYLPKINIISGEHVLLPDIESLIGSKVVDINHGTLGELNEIFEYSQNPVMQIIGEYGEILLPLQPEFIKSIDKKRTEITVAAPDGLINLNQSSI